MVALLVCKSPGTATMLTLCFRIADDPSVFESGVLTALRRSLCGVTKKKMFAAVDEILGPLAIVFAYTCVLPSSRDESGSQVFQRRGQAS